MRVRSLVVFGIGYVLGSRAGRERYAQIVEAAQRATKRLEDYSNSGVSRDIGSWSRRSEPE